MTEESVVFPFDTARQNSEMRRALALRDEVFGWDARLTSDDARNVAVILKENPTLTPDTTALIIANGMSSDDPMLSELVRKDLVMQDRHGPFQWAKAVPRIGTTVMESGWEASWPSWGRTAVRVAQGENPVTAWKNSTTSYAGNIARELMLGNPIDLGDGIFPNSTQPADQPGYYQDVQKGYDQTGNLNAAMQAASNKAIEKYGTPITSDVHDFANSTLVNKTHDGVTYSTPYSAGRALAIQVTRPETMPFQVMSALVDGSMRIGLDPSNPLFFDLTNWAMSRRAIMPDIDKVVATQIRRLRQERWGISHIDEASETAIGETRRVKPGQQRDVRIYDGSVDEEWEALQARARRNPDELFYQGKADRGYTDRFGEEMYDLENPYSMGNPDLTVGEVVDELNRQGGRRAFEDYVLEHELVHADESHELMNLGNVAERDFLETNLETAAKEFEKINNKLVDQADEAKKAGRSHEYWDDDIQEWHKANDALNMAQAEVHEYVTPIIRQLEAKAEGLAIQRLFDPEYVMQANKVRADMYRKAGIRHSYRPWLKTTQASEWLQSKQAKPVLAWLAREDRIAQIHKRLGMLPAHIKGDLARATKEADIVAILKPYLGEEISKTPRLGAARLGGAVSFRKAKPGYGHATHEFTSNYIYRPMEMAKLEARRLGAVSTPVILSPYRPNQSIESAWQWLKTIRATDDEIESVMRMVLEASGTNSYNGMMDTYAKMTGIFEKKLIGLGYSPEDILKVLDDMRFDHTVNRIYWVNYARNPLNRFDDAYKEILVGADESRSIRQLSAVTEAQFSDSWIGLPNLRDTRRATSTLRADRERAMYGYGKNNGGYWSSKGTRLGLRAGIGLGIMDKTQSIWRNWMLLRFGWPVRVVGEEMVRAHAYGYGHWLSHPIDILAQFANTKAKVSLLGDSLEDIIKLDGLGAGGWKEGEQVYDMSRVAWTPAAVGEAGYESGLLSELIQLRASRINRLVAEHGPDVAFDMIKADPTLGRLVEAIADKSDVGSTLRQISTSDEVLRRHLQSVDAMIQQSGGGRWIERTTAKAKLRDGTEYYVWRDMYEEPVLAYSAMTKQELVAIAKENNIPVGRQTQRELANTISNELRGFDDVAQLPQNRQFLTVEDGHANVRQLILDGTWGDETVLWDDMKIKEVEALEKRIVGLYDEAGATKPAVVRTAVKTGRDEQQMNTVVDRMFEMLMQKPSTMLARSPHFVTRYTEEVARMYLTAEVRQRSLIEAWVIENGFERPWRRAMQKMLDQRGLKSIPGEPLDAAELAEGRIRYAAMVEDRPVEAGAVRTQALREAADEIGIPNDVEIIEEPIENLIVPDAYPQRSGPDLRKATLDDLLNSYADEVAYRETVDWDSRGVWGGDSEGVVNAEHHRREIYRRISKGEVSSDDVLEAARRLDLDRPADGRYIMDTLDEDGMLRYQPMTETEEYVAELLAQQGIEYSPEEFYFHGSEKLPERTLFNLEGDSFYSGGLTTDFRTAYGYAAGRFGEDPTGYVYVFHRDQFGSDVSQWPRVERAGVADDFVRRHREEFFNPIDEGEYSGFYDRSQDEWERIIARKNLDPNTRHMTGDEPFHIVPEDIQPVAIIKTDDIHLEMAARRGARPEAMVYQDGKWKVAAPFGTPEDDVLALEQKIQQLFDDLDPDSLLNIENVERGINPMTKFRRDLVNDIASGQITMDEFQDALGRFVAASDMENPSSVDRLIRMNVELSGVADDAARLGSYADEVSEPGMVYHVTGSEDAASMDHFGDSLAEGGLTTDLERARYLAEEMGDDSVIQVYRQDDLPDSIRQALDSDSYGPPGNIEQGVYGARSEDDMIALQEMYAEDNFATPAFFDDEMPKPIRVEPYVPDSMPRTGTAQPGDLPKPSATVPATSPWSNRAIGILTEDQQFLQRMDDIAKAHAIEDTKNLFYDLTRRANFTDMARYVFPFGDAFLEQLRIWSRAMTPIGEQTGQALKNWRRAQIGVTNARKSGWFSEDEFGNEVMNWPGAGLMASGLAGMPGNTGLQSTIQPDQLLMMNLTPRGGLIPGTGPFIQFPASMMQPVLDQAPPLRDLINWFAFGEYGPGSLSSLDGAFDALAPTTVRRIADRFFGDRSKQVYADEIALSVEALIESDNPDYGDSEELKEATINKAQSLGSWLGFFRIADGFFSPAQPRYEPTLLIDVAGQDPFWMSIAALADEYREARDFFDTDKEAIAYMDRRFDVDALTLVGSSREVLPRPVTKQAYDEAQTHRALYEEMPNSMMMWLPHDDLDPFYHPAHERMLREGDRERLTPEQAMGLRQRQKGYLELARIQEAYDTLAIKIDRKYNGDHRNPGWSSEMNELTTWRNMERQDMYAMYPPVEPHARNIEKLSEHPTYHDTLYEVVRVGTPGTAENDIIREWQPDMAWWVEQFAAKWKSMEEGSVLMSQDAITKDWWLTSNDPGAQALRERTGAYFNRIMMQAVSNAPTPARRMQLQTQIGWFMQRVMEPLFDGYSLDDEMFLQSELPPPVFLSQQNPAPVGAASNG